MKRDESNQRAHHPESASSLQPKEWCPAYIGREGTSEAAEIGTKLHDHAERGTTAGLDDDEAALVQLCLDHVAACKEEMRQAFGNVKQIQEVYGDIDKVEWPHMKAKSTSGGYVDVVLESQTPEGPIIHVIDYKFGKWPVEEAENNLQGFVYVLNYRRQHPKLLKASVSFLLPQLEEINTHTFVQADFPAMYARVKRLVYLRAKIKEGKVSITAHERPCYHTCMWCGRIAECETLAKEIVRAGKKFVPLAVPEDLSIQSINKSSDISTWVKFADVLKSYAGAVRDRCTNLVVENPELEPDTHTLVDQADREIADHKRLEELLVETGVPIDKVVTLRKIGLTEAKKAVGDLAPKGSKTAMMKSFDDTLVDEGVVTEVGRKIYLRAKREASGE